LGQVTLPPVRERVLKALLESAIMVKLKQGALSGYDILSLFNEKFDIALSPGTVYSTLMCMERDGLITSELASRKRMYELTSEGLEALENLWNEVEGLHRFIRNILEFKV